MLSFIAILISIFVIIILLTRCYIKFQVSKNIKKLKSVQRTRNIKRRYYKKLELSFQGIIDKTAQSNVSLAIYRMDSIFTIVGSSGKELFQVKYDYPTDDFKITLVPLKATNLRKGDVISRTVVEENIRQVILDRYGRSTSVCLGEYLEN
ncbi:hypothetical protein [Pseudoalteromonas gelatinilytica]|uniref:hypothetical protein n=1 Tax=Pseudoalteromonas gelatinilytica TaxID=1703256 RepID=UPI0007C49AED|nr:hypothetical protein [Pseudoalteromonas gelatinilytica]